MKNKKIKLDDLDALIFDFDGVLTDNKVYLDQKGNEIVCCNRADGMAFIILKKIKKLHILFLQKKIKLLPLEQKN